MIQPEQCSPAKVQTVSREREGGSGGVGRGQNRSFFQRGKYTSIHSSGRKSTKGDFYQTRHFWFYRNCLNASTLKVSAAPPVEM